ncbi:MAG: ATP phosphoribosyltransferase regulatory subunit [Spirochaetales bacterium]|nr:ATP phosphoribosyltransferase regulatory subunit [Spirochaetales bacterium]
MKEKLLKTPQGAESIFLEEAYKHEKINEAINKIYTEWGYLPIKTPVFDYYENYEKLLSTNSKKNCFRLMDRDGELLLLRNDITLFLAKQLGRMLKESNQSFRVHYADSILRHQSEIDISSNEFFQTGAELVGCSGINGDLEAITLLLKIISELEIKDTKIHVGSRSILDAILNKYNLIDSSCLIELINSRDLIKLKSYLNQFMDETNSNFITKLFLFIGTFKDYLKFITTNKESIENNNIPNEIEYLKNIGDVLLDLDLIDNFRFDLSEIANRDYYTGIVFKAYTKDIDSPIASGGRYDNLIKSFGNDIPSVGFSILLRKVEDRINNEVYNPPKIKNIYGKFVEAYREAEIMRNNGIPAIIKGEK